MSSGVIGISTGKGEKTSAYTVNGWTYGDEYYTPPEAIAPILPYLDKNIPWWEPTSSMSGSIVTAMQGEGFDVYVNEGDSLQIKSFAGGVITNPPYSQKNAWIKWAIELGGPWAMLLPTDAIAGIKRVEMWQEYGLQLLVLDKRINFKKELKSSPAFWTAWFCQGVLPENLMFASVAERKD
jgi:hypothetical protein